MDSAATSRIIEALCRKTHSVTAFVPCDLCMLSKGMTTCVNPSRSIEGFNWTMRFVKNQALIEGSIEGFIEKPNLRHCIFMMKPSRIIFKVQESSLLSSLESLIDWINQAFDEPHEIRQEGLSFYFQILFSSCCCMVRASRWKWTSFLRPGDVFVNIRTSVFRHPRQFVILRHLRYFALFCESAPPQPVVLASFCHSRR